jgi:hypothetical protein
VHISFYSDELDNESETLFRVVAAALQGDFTEYVSSNANERLEQMVEFQTESFRAVDTNVEVDGVNYDDFTGQPSVRVVYTFTDDSANETTIYMRIIDQLDLSYTLYGYGMNSDKFDEFTDTFEIVP